MGTTLANKSTTVDLEIYCQGSPLGVVEARGGRVGQVVDKFPLRGQQLHRESRICAVGRMIGIARSADSVLVPLTGACPDYPSE